MTVYKWSQTASANNTIDSTINWTEGQSPGSVNNSARAVMAAVAKFRDDLSGNLVTGGSATAYTLTSNQVYASLTDGIFIRARMSATSGASPTLNVDGLGAKDILIDNTPTNIPTGALLSGSIYTFTYDSSADGWLVGDMRNDVLKTADSLDLIAIEALAGTDGVVRKTAANTYSLDPGTTAITFVKDGNGVSLTTGILGELAIPFACEISEVTLLADQSGTLVVDIWKDTYANYPPTDADTITAAAPPSISAAARATDSTLTGWTTAIAAGDILRFNLDSTNGNITRLTIILTVDRYI